MKEKILRFSFGESYVAHESEPVWLIVFMFLGSTMWLILEVILNVCAMLALFASWLLSLVIVFPTGRYPRFSKDENPRIPYWPKVYGYNVWLWTIAGFACFYHFRYSIAWGRSCVFGIVAAVMIPIIWHFATIPISVNKRPEQ